jgi:hypothetical protein
MSPIYEYGTFERWQNAQRADGQWFERFQLVNGRYGIKWSPWRRIAEKNERAGLNPYAGNARLPKD